ncbi:hypothetical protein LOTGIDRAFT_150295 [Lottia gigantea]|uniref:Protein FAM166B n=1 Tax=Lottia gigantea TaxID=225164 RepID=V4BUX1_LOTGI|nr:hypothetical protein LOTGIDRAFT_150295 [Lottia gigantea]ESO92829.1 hypothetical protein LOTGIDRAFT_150295 [Lottia gigantea]
MTTIAFGGGPTVEQRRNFAALKEGTQVPGYKGYVPQLKYRVGKTYGTDTHRLLVENSPNARNTFTLTEPIDIPTLRNTLPKSNGENKYTEKMVAGYTGYIPRMPFKFGGTYKEDCDSCIDEFMSSTQTHDLKLQDLKRQMRSYPRLTAISYDPDVRDKLNKYRDDHSTVVEVKRPLDEAPIPGYQGYVPRIGTTEIGLGQRFHESTKLGFEQFINETRRHGNLSKAEPISIDRPVTSNAPRSAPLFGRRLYANDGMIPNYTGYIPQRRYAFGNTYGDTTRSLEVCRHPDTTYAEYTKRVSFK